jgi:hypothetical protein
MTTMKSIQINLRVTEPLHRVLRHAAANEFSSASDYALTQGPQREALTIVCLAP